MMSCFDDCFLFLFLTDQISDFRMTNSKSKTAIVGPLILLTTTLLATVALAQKTCDKYNDFFVSSV